MSGIRGLSVLFVLIFLSPVFCEDFLPKLEKKSKREMTGREKRRLRGLDSGASPKFLNRIDETFLPDILISSEPEVKLYKESFRIRKPLEVNRDYKNEVFKIFKDVDNFLSSRETRREIRDNMLLNTKELEVSDTLVERVRPSMKDRFRRLEEKIKVVTSNRSSSKLIKKKNSLPIVPLSPDYGSRVEIVQRKNVFKKIGQFQSVDPKDREWVNQVKLKPNEAALKIELYDAYKNIEVNGNIEISVIDSVTMTEGAIQAYPIESGHILKLPRYQIAHIKVDAGQDFDLYQTHHYIIDTHHTLKIDLIRVMDRGASDWKPILLSIEGMNPSEVLSPKELILSQKISGAYGINLIHPAKIKLGSKGQALALSYNELNELCLSSYSSSSIWLTTQKFNINGLEFLVLGAQSEIFLKPTHDPIEQCLDLVRSAKIQNGLTILRSPSSKIKLLDKDFDPLPLFLFCGIGIDALDIVTKEDWDYYLSILKSGYQIPFIRSSKGAEGVANHIMKMNDQMTMKDFMDQIRNGKLMSGEGCDLRFSVRSPDQLKYGPGSVIKCTNDGIELSPSMKFNLNKSEGFIRRIELIFGERTHQVTPVVHNMTSGEAVFGKVKFFPGDYLMLRVHKDNGEQMITNPIYIRLEGDYDKKQVLTQKYPVEVDVEHERHQYEGEEIGVLIKGPGLFRDSDVNFGKNTFNMPLTGELEFWHKEQTQKYSVLQLLIDRIFDNASLLEENRYRFDQLINQVEKSFPLTIDLTFKETFSGNSSGNVSKKSLY